MGLPVLQLPSLVFDNVYQFLDVPEVILLSQCSKRMENLVKSKEDPRISLRVAIWKEYTNVEIVRRIDEDQSSELDVLRSKICLEWKIYSKSIRKSASSQDIAKLNIDGTNWNVGKDFHDTYHEEWYWYSVSKKGAYEQDILALVKMLRNLFNCPISNICHYYRKESSFQKLLVDTDVLHRADLIFVDQQKFKPRHMNFMFDHFITDYLIFNAYSGKDYSYQKALLFPKIDLYNATWINLEKLFEMSKTSRIMTLNGAILISDKDLNQFIKWWLISDNKTLETVTVGRRQFNISKRPGPEVWMNIPVIMDGIPSTPEKKKREEALPSHLDWYDWGRPGRGFDITRKDGVQATMLVNGEIDYETFAFVVWHQNPYV